MKSKCLCQKDEKDSNDFYAVCVNSKSTLPNDAASSKAIILNFLPLNLGIVTNVMMTVMAEKFDFVQKPTKTILASF